MNEFELSNIGFFYEKIKTKKNIFGIAIIVMLK